MATTDVIKRHVNECNLEQAARELAELLSSPEADRKPAWEEFCLGPENLLWRYARSCCQPGQPDSVRQTCEVVVEKFKQPAIVGNPPAVVGFLNDTYPGRASSLLKGQAWTVQAAAARKFGNAKNYIEQAIEDYEAALRAVVSKEEIVVAVSLAIDRLTGPPNGQGARPQRAGTWILLDQQEAKAVQVTFEIVPGTTGLLIPDLIALGLIDLDDKFYKTLREGWNFAKQRVDEVKEWGCPSGHQAVWGLARHQGVAYVHGDSGGASVALAARGAIERVQLDDAVAISATLLGGGRLGTVQGAEDKWRNAADKRCDTLLLHPETQCDPKGLPASVTRVNVETLEEAWEHVSAMHRIIGNYGLQVATEWLAQWQPGAADIDVG